MDSRRRKSFLFLLLLSGSVWGNSPGQPGRKEATRGEDSRPDWDNTTLYVEGEEKVEKGSLRNSAHGLRSWTNFISSAVRAHAACPDGRPGTNSPLESVPRSGISKRWDFPSPGARMFPPICVSGARAEKRGGRAGSSLIAFWGLSILRPVAKVRGESGGGQSRRIQPLFVTLLGKER